MSGAVAIIPARMGSTRFPGKVLAARTGRPLVRHVYDAAGRARLVGRVVVATDDASVMDAVTGFGGECVMTRTDHPNGTSRLDEAAGRLGLPGDAIVVNVQGDEPEVEPEVIDAAIEALTRTGAPMATVGAPFAVGDDPADQNIVKVVCRLDGTAMYFSRALIPLDRDRRAGPDARPLRHVGLYVYRREFLSTYVGLAGTPLERCEQLEQLRALQHGFTIAVAISPKPGRAGIDTPEQYEAFVQRWRDRPRG
jgi:3-deoxy-manno-octulosonate cytidylyltransferase (CMP-KDO synthetase)